ncbi:hypothetical protein [Catellatospora sp. NPDC049609]|uniref:hypothetical protein n=1 Tax=Catellatospora sp. NPDC049609 TaxID=3155505 RepID=UPI00343F8AB6
MEKKLTPQEFAEKLSRDELRPPVVLTGMVKASDESPSTEIMFAPGTSCGDWITVPLDSIACVEVRDVLCCDDHSHPLVELTFKSPQSPEGVMYAALLSRATKQKRIARVVKPHGEKPAPVRPEGGCCGSESSVLSECAIHCPPTMQDPSGRFCIYSCSDLGHGSYICYYEPC